MDQDSYFLSVILSRFDITEEIGECYIYRILSNRTAERLDNGKGAVVIEKTPSKHNEAT